MTEKFEELAEFDMFSENDDEQLDRSAHEKSPIYVPLLNFTDDLILIHDLEDEKRSGAQAQRA